MLEISYWPLAEKMVPHPCSKAKVFSLFRVTVSLANRVRVLTLSWEKMYIKAHGRAHSSLGKLSRHGLQAKSPCYNRLFNHVASQLLKPWGCDLG